MYGTDDKGENDGWINKDELDGTIGVKITVPADAKVGDTLTITTPDGKSVEVPITDEIKKNGHTIELDPAQFPEGEEKTVKATITEIIIYEDAGVDKVYGTNDEGENDGIINTAEKDGQVDVRVMLPDAVKVGDQLTVTGSGNKNKDITLKADDIKTDANGKKYIDVKFDPLPGNKGDFTTTATITDLAGNTGGPVDDYARFYLIAPGKPTVTIVEDKDNDGHIVPSELDGDIDINVTLPGNAKAGDVVHIDLNGDGESDDSKVLTLDDINKGTVPFTMPQADVKDNRVTVVAWVTNKEGNKGETDDDTADIVNNACIAYPVNKPEIKRRRYDRCYNG